MDETVLGLMEIAGPIILLAIMVWVVIRSRKRHRGDASPEVTERATRELYRKEERRHDDGTEGL